MKFNLYKMNYLEDKDIKYIFHLADIHIPYENVLTKKDEFIKVFDKTCEEINKKIKEKNINIEEIIIYIAGDIFDKSVRTNSDSIDLFKSFLKQLTNITYVFIIAGNHDNNKKANVNQETDLINTVLPKNKKLFYIKDTGIYNIGKNFIIYHTSIFDIDRILCSNDTPEEKRIQYLNLLPNKTNEQNKKHIMFLHNGLEFIPNIIYYKKDILEKKYDYVLLGDIHTVNNVFNTKGSIMAYPGSLLQLNYGDSNEHGFLYWDIMNYKYEMCYVYNEYGFRTLSIDDDINEIEFPINTKVRIIYNENDEESEELLKNLKLKIKEKTNIKEWKLYPIEIEKEKKNINEENEFNVFNEYINQKYDDKTIQTKLIELHNNMLKSIKYMDYNQDNNVWYLHELHINNILCFSNQQLNMNNYVKHNSIGIFGENGKGKSSINKTILYAIYGPKILTTIKTIDIHNKNAKKKSNSIKLYFQIGDTKYYIHRTMDKVNNNTSIQNKLSLYQMINNKYEDISIPDGKDATQEMIIRMFGSSDYLLYTSCFNEQFNIKNYSDKKILEMFEGVLGLIEFEKILTDISKRITNLNSETKIFNEIIEEKENNLRSKDTLDILLSKEQHTIKQINKGKIKIDSYNERILKLNNILELQKEKNKNILLNNIKELNKEIEIKESKKKIIDNNLETIINDNIKLLSTYILNEPEEIIEKNYKLYEHYNNLLNNKKYDYNKINNLKQEITEKEKIKKDIEILQSSIKYIPQDRLKNNNETILLNNNQDVSILEKNLKLLNEYNDTHFIYMTNKYEEFKQNENEIDKLQNKIERLKRSLELNNHQYNPKCECCIKNNKEKVISDSLINKELLESNEMLKVLSIKEKFNIDEYNNYRTKLNEKQKIEKDIYLINKFNEDKEYKNIDILNKKILNDINILKPKCNDIDKLNNELTEILKHFEINNELEKVFKYKDMNIILNKRKQLERIINDDKNQLNINLMQININNELDLDIKKLNEKLEILNNELNKFEYYNKKRNNKIELDKKLKECESLLKIYENKLNIILFDIKTTTNEIEILNDIKKNNNIIKETLKIYKLYKIDIDKKGFPLHLINKKLPIFIKEINKILNDIVDFIIEFEYTNKGIYLFMTKDNIKINMGSLSGFESFIITLAIRISLPKISNMIKPNFFIIDEGFDSVDEKHLSKFNNILEHLEYKYDYPIIISHSEEVKSKINFNSIIRISNNHEIK